MTQYLFCLETAAWVCCPFKISSWKDTSLLLSLTARLREAHLIPCFLAAGSTSGLGVPTLPLLAPGGWEEGASNYAWELKGELIPWTNLCFFSAWGTSSYVCMYDTFLPHKTPITKKFNVELPFILNFASPLECHTYEPYDTKAIFLSLPYT